MTPPTPRIITGAVLWTPPADPVVGFTAASVAGDTPALEFPALVPVDLTESHGIVLRHYLCEVAEIRTRLPTPAPWRRIIPRSPRSQSRMMCL